MASREGQRRRQHNHNLVPLAALISQEARSERLEKPSVRYGNAAQSRKGEDYFLMKTDCQRLPGNPSSTFSVFAIFDGHNGNAAAIFTREHLLSHVLGALPRGLGQEEWLQALPRALVAGFVKTDKEFQSRGETSGTTATFVIIDGWTVTVASVGDSRCILDAQGGAIGPLRCWPGGLCLSRSIGDMDVGEFIVPIPFVKQVKVFTLFSFGTYFILLGITNLTSLIYLCSCSKLSNAGGRLIIASDGIWDALSSDMAAKSCRGLPAELAARQVVKEALRTRGLKDDTTCIVVDIVPPDNSLQSSSPQKKQSVLKSLLFRKKSHSSNKLSKSLLGTVELSGSKHGTPGLFSCAVCQIDLAPSEGISVHAGSIFSTSSKPWQGPFLCADCRNKKDAMEGKRPSGVRVA
ncbi:putative protein phosphatase 2C 15, partial [Cucurbita argyrosperma subsp. argyrosperma]